jgi:2-C-methyl-D-erythritol 4-phosphate cytidylyltransferase
MYQVILLAAGNSSRSGLDYNKVLHPLNDNPIIFKSAINFINDDRCNKIFLVCKENEIDTFKKIFNDVNKVEYVCGGATRQQSVYNGLRFITSEYVLIHDGARPNYSTKLLNNILDKLKTYNAVIPALKVIDTIKEVKDNVVVKTINREVLRSVQTPQGFKTSLILKVHELAQNNEYTDDSSMVENLSSELVYVVNGEKSNYKYTEKEDF